MLRLISLACIRATSFRLSAYSLFFRYTYSQIADIPATRPPTIAEAASCTVRHGVLLIEQAPEKKASSNVRSSNVDSSSDAPTVGEPENFCVV